MHIGEQHKHVLTLDELIYTIVNMMIFEKSEKNKITISHKSTFIYHVFMYLPLNAYF